MPANPPAIHTVPSASPAAPGAVHAVPSASPAAPGAVHVVPSASPAAPGAVHVVPVAGGGGAGLLVGGNSLALSGVYPVVASSLQTLSGATIVEYSGSTDRWTSDGAATRPLTGLWAAIYKAYLSCPAETTLEALAPKANYTATGSQSTASQVQVFSGGVWTIYWLFDNAGNPRWLTTANAEGLDMGGAAIPAAAWLYPIPRNASVGFTGGLGGQWQNENRWLWLLMSYNNNVPNGMYTGLGASPAAAVWAPYGSATGTPTVISNGSGISTPPAIHSAPAATPATPPAITP